MYEITCNYGTCILENKEDALKTLWLLGLYHGLKINAEKVKIELVKSGFYEAFPLIIREVDS